MSTEGPSVGYWATHRGSGPLHLYRSPATLKTEMQMLKKHNKLCANKLERDKKGKGKEEEEVRRKGKGGAAGCTPDL